MRPPLEFLVLDKRLVILSEAKDLLSVEPRRAQILPSRIFLLNQRNFLLPQPTFDSFFSGYGIVHVLEGFIVNETMNFVIASKPRMDVILVLPCASIDVIGDACVKDSRLAGHEVNVEVTHVKAGFASPSMTKSRKVGGARCHTNFVTLVASADADRTHAVSPAETAGPSLRSG